MLFLCSVVLPVCGETARIVLFPNEYKSKPRLPSPYTVPYGVEYLTILTPTGYAVIPVTQEDGEIYSCMYYKTGKGKQLMVGERDFPSLGKTGLHSVPELDEKKYITGRKIGLINYLARPGRFSTPGFIGKDEDIISVLKNDNRIVSNLGLKHRDLAKPLFHVWNAILGGYLGTRRISNAAVYYYGHQLIINATEGKGYQESIFHDEIEGKWDIEISRELKPEEISILKKAFPDIAENAMTRLIRKLTTLHVSEMNPFYIMRYGFYEGYTEFRADPVAISLIFGLKPLRDIIDIFGKDLYGVMCPVPRGYKISAWNGE